MTAEAVFFFFFYFCGFIFLFKDEPVVKKRKNISLKTEKTALYLVILNKFWYSIDVVRNALTALKTLFTLRCSLRVPLSFEPTLLPREPD